MKLKDEKAWNQLVEQNTDASDKVNMSRITACVNACVGIPTEALEQGVIWELVEVCKLGLRLASSRIYQNLYMESMDVFKAALKELQPIADAFAKIKAQNVVADGCLLQDAKMKYKPGDKVIVKYVDGSAEIDTIAWVDEDTKTYGSVECCRLPIPDNDILAPAFDFGQRVRCWDEGKEKRDGLWNGYSPKDKRHAIDIGGTIAACHYDYAEAIEEEG